MIEALIMGVFSFLLWPKLLLFYTIFWQNGSKQHGQKRAKLGLQNFWHLRPKRPKLGKNIIKCVLCLHG
jgi:hypothetical protein